jgi:uncharacterized protein (TIGR02679 family)
VTCRLCDGTCTEATLDGLAAAELAWLWAGLAEAADRRGDPALRTGTTTLTAPDDVAARAAAAGLFGRRHVSAGQRVRVDLAALAERLAPLTPGAAAAHGVGRRLAQRAEAAAARTKAEAALRARAAEVIPDVAGDEAWAALRRTGWVTRLLDVHDTALLERAAAVLAQLPAPGAASVDRRVLAQAAAGDPHALDRGQPIGGLALALLVAIGRIAPGSAPRDGWAAIGVAYDDIVGGLTCLGVAPAGWNVPPGAALTLPPRTLAASSWSAGAGVVFVTENPSVLSAASIPEARVVCTSGTPSTVEVAALAALADAGWQLLVRADFDDAGLNHVAAILASAPGARPWRMGVTDYRRGLRTGDGSVPLRIERLPATPWEPALAAVMATEGVAVFEESLLDELVCDVRATAIT